MVCDYCQKKKLGTVDIEPSHGVILTICAACVVKHVVVGRQLLSQLAAVDSLHDDGYNWRPNETKAVKAAIATGRDLLGC